jgi:hypothetical protein
MKNETLCMELMNYKDYKKQHQVRIELKILNPDRITSRFSFKTIYLFEFSILYRTTNHIDLDFKKTGLIYK